MNSPIRGLPASVFALVMMLVGLWASGVAHAQTVTQVLREVPLGTAQLDSGQTLSGFYYAKGGETHFHMPFKTWLAYVHAYNPKYPDERRIPINVPLSVPSPTGKDVGAPLGMRLPEGDVQSVYHYECSYPERPAVCKRVFAARIAPLPTVTSLPINAATTTEVRALEAQVADLTAQVGSLRITLDATRADMRTGISQLNDRMSAVYQTLADMRTEFNDGLAALDKDISTVTGTDLPLLSTTLVQRIDVLRTAEAAHAAQIMQGIADLEGVLITRIDVLQTEVRVAQAAASANSIQEVWNRNAWWIVTMLVVMGILVALLLVAKRKYPTQYRRVFPASDELARAERAEAAFAAERRERLDLLRQFGVDREALEAAHTRAQEAHARAESFLPGARFDFVLPATGRRISTRVHSVYSVNGKLRRRLVQPCQQHRPDSDLDMDRDLVWENNLPKHVADCAQCQHDLTAGPRGPAAAPMRSELVGAVD